MISWLPNYLITSYECLTLRGHPSVFLWYLIGRKLSIFQKVENIFYEITQGYHTYFETRRRLLRLFAKRPSKLWKDKLMLKGLQFLLIMRVCFKSSFLYIYIYGTSFYTPTNKNKWETFEEHKSQEGAAIIFSSSKFSQCTPVFILIFLPQVAVMLQCQLHFVSPQHFDHCEDEYHCW